MKLEVATMGIHLGVNKHRTRILVHENMSTCSEGTYQELES